MQNFIRRYISTRILNPLCRLANAALLSAPMLAKGNAYIMLIGEVSYYDMFGVHHWTKFCEMSDSQIDLAMAKKCIAFGAVNVNQPKAYGQPPNPK